MSTAESPPPKKKTIKSLYIRVLFKVILLLPWLLLLLAVILVVKDIYLLNGIQHPDIYEKVSQHLESKKPTSVPMPHPMPHHLPKLSKSEVNIFLFGASSVVLSDQGTFDQYLQKKFDRKSTKVRITNFGYCGIDSHTIKHLLVEALQKSPARPDLLIFYMGHNDYTNAYHHVVSKSWDVFEEFLWLPYLFSGLEQDFSWFMRLKTPGILQFLQEKGLVEISQEGYGDYDEIIQKHFEKNVGQIIKEATSRDIPILFITPIGNLRMEPFGHVERVTKPFQLGMQTSDYKAALELLTKARDEEILSYDVRAKSELNQFLRTLSAPKVHVFDLESHLIEMKFSFGNDDFMDYFHMNHKTHKLLAKGLHEFMQADTNLKELFEATPPVE